MSLGTRAANPNLFHMDIHLNPAAKELLELGMSPAQRQEMGHSQSFPWTLGKLQAQGMGEGNLLLTAQRQNPGKLS